MNVNFHISRYTFLMILVAVLFVLLVVKAFTYLPEDQSDALLMQNAKNKVLDANYDKTKITDNSDSDSVTDLSDETTNQDNEIENLLAKANEFVLNKDYNNALILYLDVVRKVNNPQIYAICYDGIAKIYTEQNKYDKAIEKAKLAYKYDPNDTRRLTLVKLYRQVGDTENEQNMLDELLEEK